MQQAVAPRDGPARDAVPTAKEVDHPPAAGVAPGSLSGGAIPEGVTPPSPSSLSAWQRLCLCAAPPPVAGVPEPQPQLQPQPQPTPEPEPEPELEPEPEPEPEPAPAGAVRLSEGLLPQKLTLKDVADAIKGELGLDESLPMKGVPAAAAEQAGFEVAAGTLKAQLDAIATECGIWTGW